MHATAALFNADLYALLFETTMNFNAILFGLTC